MDSIDTCDREGKWIFDSMSLWDGKCVWAKMWLQDTTDFQDIYRKVDGKWLLDTMRV